MQQTSSPPFVIKFWQGLKRKVRQITILIVSLWLFDLTLEHTLMYWRANVFAANLCHALESKEYREVTSMKRVKIPGARPFGPGLSEEFKSSVDWKDIGWAETECRYQVRFGDAWSPWYERCSAITYTITIRPISPGFPLMRIKYNLLSNFLDSQNYDHTDLLDVYVKGYSSKGFNRPWRYPIYLMRPFLCHPLSNFF